MWNKRKRVEGNHATTNIEVTIDDNPHCDSKFKDVRFNGLTIPHIKVAINELDVVELYRYRKGKWELTSRATDYDHAIDQIVLWLEIIIADYNAPR